MKIPWKGGSLLRLTGITMGIQDYVKAKENHNKLLFKSREVHVYGEGI